MIQSKLIDKNFNIMNIKAMKIKLLKLQDNNKTIKKFKTEKLLKG